MDVWARASGQIVEANMATPLSTVEGRGHPWSSFHSIFEGPAATGSSEVSRLQKTIIGLVRINQPVERTVDGDAQHATA